MATLVLAHPTADKRKASYVSVSDGDVVDIRGFGSFTAVVTATLGAVATVKVSATEGGTYATLKSLGSSATALDTIAVTISIAYDLPELAGCHYVKFDGMTSGTIELMGKV